MTSRAAVLALAVLVPSTALAGPTVGVALGSSEAKADAANGASANTTDGIFVRGRLSPRLSLQGELSKLQTDSGSGNSIRAWNVTTIFDLGHGALVPIVLAGAGLDVLSHDAYGGSSDTFVHAELGGGLEYRFRGGLMLGADVRIGSRSATTQTQATPVYAAGIKGGTALFAASSSLSEGEYRSMRVTLGVRF